MQTLLRLTDELTHAKNYLERAELLIGGIEEEYFNEREHDPDTAKGREYIVGAYNETRIKVNIARDYLVQMRETLADMAGLIRRDTAPTYRLDQLARAGASLASMGKAGMEQALALLVKYGVEEVNCLKPGQYAAFAADLRALGARI